MDYKLSHPSAAAVHVTGLSTVGNGRRGGGGGGGGEFPAALNNLVDSRSIALG